MGRAVGVGTLLVMFAPWTVSAQSTESGAGLGGRAAGIEEEGRSPSSVDPWEQEPLPLKRVTGPISLDGRPDEPAWLALDTFPVVQFLPVFMGPKTGRTTIRIGYDDDYLYAAGWFYDDPSLVQDNTLERDGWDGDDTFEIIIDSYNDNQTALQFATNPSGVLIDGTVRNDAQPDGTNQGVISADWNAFWDAASTRTDEGWFTEMRIPLSSLGYSVEDGRTVMGLITDRYIARYNEKQIFPAIPPNRESADFMPSRARDIVLEGVTEKRAIRAIPYVLSGMERIREPDLDVVRAPGTDLTRDVGIDVKYGVSSNLTLDLTANTDFAQVESDALEVNLDRFNLFFPEKRQFFQERASTFDFNMDQARLFHSRRIGLSEDGDPRRILGGARLAGRIGDWDVGLLSMQVASDDVAPWENDGVLRLQRTFSGRQGAGLMVTSRTDGDGATDLSLGVDGRVAVGRDLVTVQLAQTDNDNDVGASFADRTMARLFWERRNTAGWSYEWDLSRSGPAYDPALGFEFRDDFTSLKGQLQYAWQPGPESPVSRYYVHVRGAVFERNSDHVVESAWTRLRLITDLKNGGYYTLAFNFLNENVAEPLEFPGADVPAGTFKNINVYSRFDAGRSRWWGGEAEVWMGSQFGGWRTQMTLSPILRVSRHLSFSGMLRYDRLRFSERDQVVNANIARLRVQAALDTHLSAAAFVQYSETSETVSTNVRVRYRFSEGRDLFLVLDEGRDLEDRFGVDSALLGRTDRRLLLKYSHALVP